MMLSKLMKLMCFCPFQNLKDVATHMILHAAITLDIILEVFKYWLF